MKLTFNRFQVFFDQLMVIIQNGQLHRLNAEIKSDQKLCHPVLHVLLRLLYVFLFIYLFICFSLFEFLKELGITILKGDFFSINKNFLNFCSEFK